jgi:hypothetical protein
MVKSTYKARGYTMGFRSGFLIAIQMAIVLLFSATVAIAQTAEQCRALLVQALSELEANCTGLDANSTCYGFETVSAAFAEPVPDRFFTSPGDVADLNSVQSITTSQASFQESTLGISLMHIQANLPDSQHAVFLLVGGQAIESGVQLTSPIAPFQSFFLMGEPGTSDCYAEIEPLLFIQGPEETPVELVVYGIPIRIESTIIVRTVPPNDPEPERLEFIVLSGQLVLNPGTPNELIIPAGSVVSIDLGDQPLSLGSEGDADERQLGTEFSVVRVLTAEEIDYLSFLAENLPVGILNYDLVFPPTEPITATTPTPPPGGTTGGGTVIVGPVPVTPVCSTFALTSPLQGMAYGLNTVYWNPAIGVTGYVVSVTNLDNGQSSSVAVGPGATNAQIDTSTLGSGFNFQLSVAALGTNGVVCQDVRTMLRAAAPDTGGGDDDDDEDECPAGQQPSGVGGACVPIP